MALRKLILKNSYSLGDVIMMTAAVRDLHRCYPEKFLTDVRTYFPEIWEQNPYITYLEERDPSVQVIDCKYPLIDHANYRPYHCLHGYISFLNSTLRLQISPTEFKGDIHLSQEEKEWASQVHELAGIDLPFWIVAAGGKYDITIKWWSTERYQHVVNHFEGKIAFVQIGELGHHHPKLKNTIDLRGKTSVRELIRLVYHSQGCLGPITSLMHLAAAVDTQPDRPQNRACVVIGGGREPASWESYPHHQFLHNVGALRCCSQGGCWRDRTMPLRDNDPHDQKENLCLDVVGDLPRCMAMIKPEDAIRSISAYFEGETLSWLTKREQSAASRAIHASSTNSYDEDSISRYNSVTLFERAIGKIRPYPGGFQGRGIVICGGGLKYFPSVWVCIAMLRYLGCNLRIELWFRGEEEIDTRMKEMLSPFGVTFIDSLLVETEHPRRMTGGWELKAYAILHSAFKEVLLLDADNVPVRDPSYLFESTAFQETGALFWPDYGRLSEDREIWRLCNIAYRDEPEFESGQILIDKKKSWRALGLALWLNEHSDFFYNYIHGDKETFHLAWRKLDQPYTMVPYPIQTLKGTMCQHDLEGNRIFQHRNGRKWKVFSSNPRIEGFEHEGKCFELIKELEQRWNGKVFLAATDRQRSDQFISREGTCDKNVFISVCEKNEYELPERFHTRDVIIDIGAHIGSFTYACLLRGAGRILAFEPEIGNFKIAQVNLAPYQSRVRLFQKAVWRSDKHPGCLLHSGYSYSGNEINTGGGTVLIATEEGQERKPKEAVSTIRLDAILKSFKSVRLLKLDCEGSEWPILLTSKLLYKVQAVCGEYHRLSVIPTSARVDKYCEYTEKVLEAFLRKHYKNVRIQPSGAPALGHFWASA